MMHDPTDKKSFDWLMAVQTMLVGVTTVILTAGIPWAYFMGNEVAVIKANSIATSDTMRELRVNSSDGFRDHERRISGLETELAIIKQLAEGVRRAKQ
jgi:hypothetical protein